MAATASSDHHKIHLHKNPTTTIKFRRRRLKETTISSTAITTTNHHQHPSVVSPENSSWCCPSVVSSSKPPPQPPSPQTTTSKPQPSSDSPALPPSRESLSDDSSLSIEKFLILSSNSPVNLDKTNMTTTTAVYGGGSNHQETFPSSFTNFNSALTAGLLNPMSPPPPTNDKTRSSPTLFEMMANEPDSKIPNHPNGNVSYPTPKKPNNHVIPPIIIDKQALMQQRLLDLLSCRSPGSQFNDPNSSDVKLTLTSKDGLSVSMNAHRQILLCHSRFFAVKLSEYRWKGGQQGQQQPYIIEIADCDDIEVYIESIRLMYCKNLRRKLMKEDVPRVLGILKVSAAIGFDAGVLSCLEYLEAAPWAEDEEEKVSSLLSELRLEGVGATEVLKRVSVDFSSGVDEGNNNEEVLLKLLHTVLDGKDEKARREMKVLVAKMLRENSSQHDLRKESLYSACEKCLLLLREHFLKASNGELQDVAQITRQADNLHWLLDILIDRQIAEDFLKSWASLAELSEVHSKVPPLHRYEISRVTARMFVGIGKGQLLASKDLRCLLLQTWLVPFYDDFAWMKRASRGLDRHLIEDGLGNTILTLPLSWQQEILMSWFDRFLNSSDDCPNIQRAFEVWWRRAFWRKNCQQPERSLQFRVTDENFKNS
ncbi:BTB/POZ domain-containing protein At1g63850-like [Cynara cardunculus var. scolymus]|uniref:BTB/POZ-like protein n=1 Tax=Cynara cardunculus var. scolymus TaxID=59895 RepID=A0A103XGA6_CYNCS|nr:BTB/POZ domain-containing protein At1g63850-like [Cynara cardunculus var. scolymus]KVH90128.1 BTB/POZ-like protein [Cynara cardunculus var. scolymus]